MYYLLFPFFIVRLLIELVPSLLVLFSLKLAPHRSIIAALIVIIISTSTLINSKILAKKEIIPPSTEKIIAQKEVLESWLAKQPADQDLLLNLAKVYQALGDEDQALATLNKIKEINPNNQNIEFME